MLLVNSKTALLPITCIKVFNCPLSRAAKKLTIVRNHDKNPFLPICSLTLPVSWSLNRNDKQLTGERVRCPGDRQKGSVCALSGHDGHVLNHCNFSSPAPADPRT